MDLTILDIGLETAELAMTTAVPWAGLAFNLMKKGVENRGEKRLNEWKSHITAIVNCLIRNTISMEDLEELFKSEYFFSAVQIATEGALKAHTEEKRTMFANALYNGFAMKDVSEDKKIFFFPLLDKYTITHIKFLKGYFNIIGMGGIKKRGDNSLFYSSIKKNLISDGLLYEVQLKSEVRVLVTDLGKEFLQFIKTPEEETK
ncbi:MAG: hypothetical protein FWD82_08240 [Defluviitaleaceae bacterium]|nr:hypothetical protein [Defluviitaleaceae bacterium]